MRSHITTALLSSLALGALAQTQVGETCVANGVCYKLNIPEATAQSGNGDIFLSLSGPTTYSWIGLGIGASMSNANMFIIYSDGRGNVTLSPRLSRSQVQPQYNADLDVELLSGSGIENGVMTANLRCGNCAQGGAGSFGAQSGQWIHARRSGDALDSTNVQTNIVQHSAYDSFTWSYSNAVGGTSTNPFVASDTVVSGNVAPSSDGNRAMRSNILLAHVVLAPLAFLVFFPVGAIVMRLGTFSNALKVHVATQILSWLLFAAAFGLGLYYGITGDYMSEAHPIIGIVLVAMLMVQPFAGWLHHRQFVRSGQRSAVSHGHIWIGRIAVILGMINGGLGLQLGGVETRYVIAYSVVAGVIGLAYIGSIVFGEINRSRQASAPLRDQEKVSSSPERSSRSA